MTFAPPHRAARQDRRTRSDIALSARSFLAGPAVERQAEAMAARATRGIGAAPGGLRPDGGLDAAMRGHFEPRFGADLGAVRVRADAAAGAVARTMGARALTTGNRILFAPGRFAPGSAAGGALVAHELAHVVQQRRQGTRFIAAKLEDWLASRDIEDVPEPDLRGDKVLLRNWLDSHSVMAEEWGAYSAALTLITARLAQIDAVRAAQVPVCGGSDLLCGGGDAEADYAGVEQKLKLDGISDQERKLLEVKLEDAALRLGRTPEEDRLKRLRAALFPGGTAGAEALLAHSRAVVSIIPDPADPGRLVLPVEGDRITVTDAERDRLTRALLDHLSGAREALAFGIDFAWGKYESRVAFDRESGFNRVIGGVTGYLSPGADSLEASLRSGHSLSMYQRSRLREAIAAGSLVEAVQLANELNATAEAMRADAENYLTSRTLGGERTIDAIKDVAATLAISVATAGFGASFAGTGTTLGTLGRGARVVAGLQTIGAAGLAGAGTRGLSTLGGDLLAGDSLGTALREAGADAWKGAQTGLRAGVVTVLTGGTALVLSGGVVPALPKEAAAMAASAIVTGGDTAIAALLAGRPLDEAIGVGVAQALGGALIGRLGLDPDLKKRLIGGGIATFVMSYGTARLQGATEQDAARAAVTALAGHFGSVMTAPGREAGKRAYDATARFARLQGKRAGRALSLAYAGLQIGLGPRSGFGATAVGPVPELHLSTTPGGGSSGATGVGETDSPFSPRLGRGAGFAADATGTQAVPSGGSRSRLAIPGTAAFSAPLRLTLPTAGVTSPAAPPSIGSGSATRSPIPGETRAAAPSASVGVTSLRAPAKGVAWPLTPRRMVGESERFTNYNSARFDTLMMMRAEPRYETILAFRPGSREHFTSQGNDRGATIDLNTVRHDADGGSTLVTLFHSHQLVFWETGIREAGEVRDKSNPTPDDRIAALEVEVNRQAWPSMVDWAGLFRQFADLRAWRHDENAKSQAPDQPPRRDVDAPLFQRIIVTFVHPNGRIVRSETKFGMDPRMMLDGRYAPFALDLARSDGTQSPRRWFHSLTEVLDAMKKAGLNAGGLNGAGMPQDWIIGEGAAPGAISGQSDRSALAPIDPAQPTKVELAGAQPGRTAGTPVGGQPAPGVATVAITGWIRDQLRERTWSKPDTKESMPLYKLVDLAAKAASNKAIVPLAALTQRLTGEENRVKGVKFGNVPWIEAAIAQFEKESGIKIRWFEDSQYDHTDGKNPYIVEKGDSATWRRMGHVGRLSMATRLKGAKLEEFRRELLHEVCANAVGGPQGMIKLNADALSDQERFELAPLSVEVVKPGEFEKIHAGRLLEIVVLESSVADLAADPAGTVRKLFPWAVTPASGKP